LPEGLTIALYFTICIFWFVWWAAAIRCPTCGIRIGWYQMNRGSAGDVATRMAMTGSCPACGFKGDRPITIYVKLLDEGVECC
jgi:predicted RNA-binding Zn-ribbon protein involved in translation (DUF1610 family)